MLEASHFSLGDGWSFAVTAVSVVWLLGTAVLMLLPTVRPITAGNMNYTSVIAAGVFLLGTLNWELNTKTHFRGPKRSDDDDEEQVTEGGETVNINPTAVGYDKYAKVPRKDDIFSPAHEDDPLFTKPTSSTNSNRKPAM
jgi:hypothetical protein